MLLTISGSSCSGKTTTVRACGPIDGLVWHDFDEIGVPDDADLVWRHRSLEGWLQKALRYQADGLDMLLTGQSPLGEVLACPSAPLLDGIAACLLDVDDDVRRQRLAQRDPGKWDDRATDRFIGWARWQRAHAADRWHLPEAITAGGWEPMRWDRWADLPGWAVTVIDTTGRSVEESAADLRRWIDDQRRSANQDIA
ncbi:hypothetical protein Aph02nite_29710 [Actinoplanes philippinensis]|uniref:AAA domain-containing protein n=1 Tax=Actinoplanes philippinensis TaxID=35752 RepID=A0A1I2EFQ2_9ACTN|nr:hypothetical protein [Actinoplanes philippinensis]GIE77021.1 hypothetical protein Aph02nite_29710 [Actinoplanes philippinensis]SFE91772.1 hypothetical protein SAMN05421541_104436 [Actinoplanes philippinensis]